MGLFNLFRAKPSGAIDMTVRAPEYFETTSVKVSIQVFLSSKSPQKIVKTVARLRADATKHNHKANTSSNQILGEATEEREIIIDPAKPNEVGFEIPIDFSVIDSFEIPPENLAIASREVQKAAAENRTLNYRYSIEVIAKLAGGAEQAFSQPIRLAQPNEVRAG